jgi:quercetin dioxygenase-like cupin family protein
MKITRWTAEIPVNKDIILKLFEAEGLEPRPFNIKSGSRLINQRTHLNEIIQIAEGELIFNLSGTQFVLRAGDKLELPANTGYSFSNIKNEESVMYSAQKI